MGALRPEGARYFTSICSGLLDDSATREGSFSYEGSPPTWISR